MALTDLQEAAVEKMAKAEKLSPMEVSEAEDEISGWLDDHGIDDGGIWRPPWSPPAWTLSGSTKWLRPYRHRFA